MNRIRAWLIRLLVGKSMVVMNVTVVGWLKGKPGLVSGCTFEQEPDVTASWVYDARQGEVTP